MNDEVSTRVLFVCMGAQDAVPAIETELAGIERKIGKLLDALPDLVPALVERWRGLVAEIEGLTGNPAVGPGELDTARGHLHALLGQVTLKPKDGVLWAYLK